MTASLGDPLTLPCGAVLKNRLAKASMTEGLADTHNCPTAEHELLYRRWADGGAGLLLTGNVQIDRRHLERPGNVAIDGNGGLDRLAAYASAGSENDTHIWMQINHPGRQAYTANRLGPSADADPNRESPARALAPQEIADIISRFAHVASVARDTGFTGVQVHAAHGYLMSQFLSPLTNRRQDEWGGSLENRARALLEAVRAVRRAVGSDFPVSVKLNSADFQKGGLTEDDSFQVVKWLQEIGIDLLEISGGSYESQIMVGRDEDSNLVETKTASTLAREAYFLSFAARLRPHVKIPLMVTGGFRTLTAMEAALAADELDIIGLARPLCLDPDFCNQLLDGSIAVLPSPDAAATIDPAALGNPDAAMLRTRTVDASIAFSFNQLRNLAAGQDSESDIDWLEQLDRHEAFDEAAYERYLQTI